MVYPVSGIPSADSRMTKLWMRLCPILKTCQKKFFSFFSQIVMVFFTVLKDLTKLPKFRLEEHLNFGLFLDKFLNVWSLCLALNFWHKDLM